MMGGCRPPAVTTAAGADRSMEIAGGAITKRRREQGLHEYMRDIHHGVLRGRTTCEMKLRKKMVMGRPNLLSQISKHSCSSVATSANPSGKRVSDSIDRD
jgi:hypothetical protein